MMDESRQTDKLRIAHVTATFPPYCGGAGTVCYHHALELARHGHEVHVLTAAADGVRDREVRDGFTIHRLRPLVQIGNAPLLPGLLHVLSGFDIIHLHSPFILGAELSCLAASLYGTPLVVSFHNDLIGERTRDRIFRIYQHLSAHLTIRNAARLCVLSYDHYRSSRLYRSLAAQRLKTVELPNGVDLDRFYPSGDGDQIRRRYGIPEGAKVVLFVAALDRAHHFKGLGILLKAIQTLPVDVWLLVVGDGDLREEYMQQSNELGISNRVIFAGKIQHENTPPFFRSANVTVLPSSLPESFGLVLIESLACGTPVIATRLPGVRTVVNQDNDGMLVEPNQPIELAGAIRTIIENDSLRRAMGQRGRVKVADRYDWKQIGSRLEAIYCQVMEEAARRRCSTNHAREPRFN